MPKAGSFRTYQKFLMAALCFGRNSFPGSKKNFAVLQWVLEWVAPFNELKRPPLCAMQSIFEYTFSCGKIFDFGNLRLLITHCTYLFVHLCTYTCNRTKTRHTGRPLKTGTLVGEYLFYATFFLSEASFSPKQRFFFAFWGIEWIPLLGTL